MWVAAAIAGAGILGAGASIYASNQQQKSAQNAINAQQGMFNQGLSAEQPYMQAGTAAGGKLAAGFAPTMANLESTPGYQFTLDQGLKAVTNANSAMGLANSGVQGKGIANYAEGLAGTTFQQQYQNWLQPLQTLYQGGSNAASGIMGGAVNTGSGIANSNIMQGNAAAAGALGVAGAGSNAANQYMQFNLMKQLFGQNNAGSIGDAGGLVGANQAPWGSGGYNFLDAAAT